MGFARWESSPACSHLDLPSSIAWAAVAQRCTLGVGFFFLGASRMRGLESIHHRHLHLHEDEVILGAIPFLHGFDATPSAIDRMIRMFAARHFRHVEPELGSDLYVVWDLKAGAKVERNRIHQVACGGAETRLP